MAQQNYNFQRLVEQLGLKNVADLPVVEAITPVMVIGDGQQIAAPLLPPSAWAGATQGVVAGQRATLQLRVRASGGAFVEYFSSGAAQTVFRVDRDGVDPLAADPLLTVSPKFETGFGTTLSEVRVDTSTISISVERVPVFFTGITFSEWGETAGFFIPSGGIFTVQHGVVATVGYFTIRWREVPSAALNPTPD